MPPRREARPSCWNWGDLAARLRAVYEGRPDKVLFVKADPGLRYAAVIDAMDVARGAGVRVIGWP